jgi:hypothetical protein
VTFCFVAPSTAAAARNEVARVGLTSVARTSTWSATYSTGGVAGAIDEADPAVLEPERRDEHRRRAAARGGPRAPFGADLSPPSDATLSPARRGSP